MNSVTYSFGDCELDAAKRELRCAGQVVDLQPRVFDLLLHLVKHSDRAVGKDELQDKVWPGMVITEAALTRAVMKARKAIGDDASTQSVIRTVHGHGYRFVAPVEIKEIEPTAELTPPSQPAQKRLLFFMAPLIILLAMTGLWYAMKDSSPREEFRLAVLPLVDQTGDPEMAWSELGLMSLASKTLASEGEIPVVSDGNVASLVSSLGWNRNRDELADSELPDRLRQIYGATHVLAMELLREGPMLRMNFTLLQEGGKMRHGTMVGRDGVELTQGVVQAVYGLLLQKSRLGNDIVPVSEDPFNNEAFARGMALSIEGRCAEAITFFRLIQEQEPDLFAPRLELASCLRILGEPAEAEEILSALIQEQSKRENPAATGQALMVLGILQNRTGRLDDARDSYAKALAAARQADDHELAARITHNLAILAKTRGDLVASEEYLDRASAGYRRAGREIMPGHLWSGYANLKMAQGELAEAGAYLDLALEAFRAAGDRRNEAMMLNNYGYLRRLQGRLDEAEDYHLQSLAIREEINDPVGVGRIHSMLSVLYSSRGDYEQARDSAEKALTIARETRDRLFEGTSLAQLANAERNLDLSIAARTHYHESRTVFLSLQDTMRVIQVDLKLAEMMLEEGKLSDAKDLALESLNQAVNGGFVEPEIEALSLLGDISISGDEPQEALLHYQNAWQRVHETSFDALAQSILIKLANLQMDLENLLETERLVGALANLEPSASALKTQARYAWLSGDAGNATKLMSEAREQAGDRWDEADQAQLEIYQELMTE